MEEMFDLEIYVRKKLMEIEDTDERKFAKEVLLEGLLPIFRLTEKRYLDLEERIKKEIDVGQDNYVVCTTVVRQDNYDPINGTLFPICPEVLKEEKNIEEGERPLPYIIFFNGGYIRKKEFENLKVLRACDEEGRQHMAGIRKARCYQDAVSDLYDVFVYNKIRWTTVNTGQIDRFYEIYPVEDETIDIKNWKIDFGEMDEYVECGIIPLWNIEKFSFQCRKFMIPCVDDKYYEHELNLNNYDQDSGYMLGINEDVLSVRYEKNKIIMTSLKESFRDWIAYRFIGNIDTQSHGYVYEFLDNHRENSFSQNFIERGAALFVSRTELYRMIQSFPITGYIEIFDCRVIEEEPEDSFWADMNLFIKEEIFPMEARKILELRFRKKRKSIYVEDMVRFAVSELQQQLHEYKCVGVLVRDDDLQINETV